MLRFLFFLLLVPVAQGAWSQSKSVDSLEHIVALNKGDESHMAALVLLSQLHRGKDNAKAADYARTVLLKAHRYPVARAKANMILGLIYSERNAFDSASLFFQDAESIVNELPQDRQLRSVLYNALGLFQKKQGDLAKALEYYMLLDQLGEEGLAREDIAGNQLNIANIYNRMGNRREAIGYLYKALALFEAINNAKGMSYCYNSLGILLKDQDNLVDAETYLRKALHLKEKEGDLKGIATSSNELALLSLQKNEYDTAVYHIDRTIELSEKLGLLDLHVTGLINKGKILRMDGKLDQAELYFAKAEPLLKRLQDKLFLAGLLSEKGKLYNEKHEYSQAIKVLSSAVTTAEKSSNIEAQLNARLFLSQAYAGSGRHKDALEEYQKYHLMTDSMRSNKLKLEYKALETQYEVEKKNAEIAMLKKDQELQARTLEWQRAIQIGIAIALISVIIAAVALINRYRVVNRTRRQLELERVRNNIARDLHDDIGSTMSSIHIVSQMALTQHAANGVAEIHFKRIADNTSAIMERMSDIVWSINPANDSVSMMASKMKEFAGEILEPKDIQYKFTGLEQVEGEVLQAEKRKNLFLIYKEVINNAAKYSEASEISVDLYKKNKGLMIHIADNGKGFDLMSHKKGNGLNNIHARAEAILAKVDIQSSPGQGTIVSLFVPLT